MLRIDAPAPEPAILRQFAYQPFEFADGTRTGVGLGHVTGSAERVLRPGDAKWQPFSEANARLASMYENLIAAITDEFGDEVRDLTYADVACNAGYFVLRMSQIGVKESVGIDALDYRGAWAYATKHLGANVRFERAPYDMLTHRLPGEPRQFDIVSNIAFMCHASDPTFLLEHLASMARRCLVIYTKFIRSDDYIVRYSKATSRYFRGRFPICFDAATEMSDSLLVFGLKECGFTTVREIPGRPGWTLAPAHWRAFIATR